MDETRRPAEAAPPAAHLGPTLREATPYERRFVERWRARAVVLVRASFGLLAALFVPLSVATALEEPLAGVLLAAVGVGALAAFRWLGSRLLPVRVTPDVVALRGPLSHVEVDPGPVNHLVGAARTLVPRPWMDHVVEGEFVRCEAVRVVTPGQAEVGFVVALQNETASGDAAGPALSVDHEGGAGTPLDLRGAVLWPSLAAVAFLPALFVAVMAAFSDSPTTASWAAAIAGVAAAAFAVGAARYERARGRFFALYGLSDLAAFRRFHRRQVVRAAAVSGVVALPVALLGWAPWWAAAAVGAIGSSPAFYFAPVRYPHGQVGTSGP